MRILPLLGLVLGAAVVFLASVWLFQRRLIYYPETPSLPRPEALLAGASAVAFETADGLTLAGWFVPPVAPSSGAAVLVCNGNAGSRVDRVPLAQAFARTGFAVLLFDYRGYGGNPGRPSEAGLIHDGRAARTYLAGRPGVDPARIVLYGESLGAAVAVALAAEAEPAALVLRSPFTSMADVGRLHYPLLPVRLLLRDRFPSRERIRGVRCPLLVIAARGDRVVPHAQSRELFEAAGSPARRFVSLAQGDHNDSELIGDDVMRQTISFLAEETKIPLARTAARSAGQQEGS